MSTSTKKTEKRKKLGGERIRLIAYFLLAAICIALFLIFGRSGRSIPSEASVSPSPAPIPTAEPKGVPMGRFVRALEQSEMDCVFGEMRALDNNSFEYPLSLPDGREGAKLSIKTDAIGRIAECTLELTYKYVGEPDSSYSNAIAEAIISEYRRREKSDTALISALLNCIYEQLSDDLNLSTIDSKKIADSIIAAYYSGKTYDKKSGGSRFYCETKNADEAAFLHTFRAIASFDYAK